MKQSTELTRRGPSQPLAAPAAVQPVPGFVTAEALTSLLWRKKWLVTGCLAVGLSLGLAAALLQQPVYRATTTVEVQIPNDDYLNRRQLDPSLPPGALNLEPYLQTEMKRLTSDGLLWGVVEDLGLQQHAEFRPKPGQPTPQRGALLEDLRGRLIVRLSGQAQVVEISFEAHDAHLAADFANKLVENYRAASIDRRRSTAAQSAELMAGQLTSLRRNLETAQVRLQGFVRNKGVMSGLDREGLAEARLRQLQAAHVTAQEARIAEESRFTETVSKGTGELDNDTLAKYRIQLTELERRRAEAAEVYQPAHVKVRQIEAEIATLEKSLEAEKANLLRRMKTGVNAASTREQSLAKDLNHQATLAAEQVAGEVEFTSLKHDVDGYQQLYDSLQQKVREARLAAAVPSNTVLILDKADTPFEPVRPKRLFLLAIGGFCGLLVGLLLVLGTAAAAPAVKRRPSAGVLVPHLASIPRYDDGLRGRPELGVARQPDSPFAESFRRLASRTFTSHAHVWPRILIVSGLEPHRGRTTVAVNLAITLAKEGQNVLLADADSMSPQVRMQLGIRGGRVLMAGGNTETEPRPLCPVWTTSVPGLSLVRLDGIAAFGADGHLLQELESDFDAVIVDAPALVQWPEAAWSQRFADGVLLVSGRDDIAAPGVSQLLGQITVPVLGSVANSGAWRKELPAMTGTKEIA